MQTTSFLGRLGTFAATSFVAGLICTDAKALTFATFQQVVTAGDPSAAINFEVLPSGSFTATSPSGNPVVINWLDASLGAGSQTAYLTIGGTLVGAPNVGGGGLAPVSQNFSTLHFEFWSGPNQSGVKILDVIGDGGIVSTAPYNSVGGSAGGTVVFSSDVPAIQSALDSLFNLDRSTSFALTSLLDATTGAPNLTFQEDGDIAPFTANLSGSFAAIPEPTTLGLAFLGLAGLIGLRRKN